MDLKIKLYRRTPGGSLEPLKDCYMLEGISLEMARRQAVDNLEAAKPNASVVKIFVIGTGESVFTYPQEAENA
jgi:hypothetical protein